MKTKLTLSIDADVARRAKAFARQHNRTVSAIVEEQLDRATSPSMKDFLDQWIESNPSARMVEVEDGDQRFEYLRDKYLHD